MTSDPDLVWVNKQGEEVIRITAEDWKRGRKKALEERARPLREEALQMIEGDGATDAEIAEAVEEYTEYGVHPDWIMDTILWPHWCVDSIEIAWDQWMRVRIHCSHGTFEGVSDGMWNMIGQSLLRATREFLKANHGEEADAEPEHSPEERSDQADQADQRGAEPAVD